jgi:hypothetical protein
LASSAGLSRFASRSAKELSANAGRGSTSSERVISA